MIRTECWPVDTRKIVFAVIGTHKMRCVRAFRELYTGWIKCWLKDIAVYSLAVGLQLDRTEFSFFQHARLLSVLILRLMSFVEDYWRYSRPSGLPVAITANSTIQSCGFADLQFSWHSLQQISAWSLELHTCFAIGQCRFLEVWSPFPVADSL